jgi:Reverse transcriptase (RNA-dependent DNA polymerase)
VIFGYPWLKFFNPKVNWTQGVLKEPPVKVETSHLKHWKKRQLILKAHADARSVGEGKRAHIVRTNLPQQWAKEANKAKAMQENLELPAKYQRHAIVFSEEVAKRFPLAQLKDHIIKLKDGAPDTINCKVYPLTKPEQEATRKFIEENEALGFIQKTDSPWSTPWFFIKKKDGSLRPIQDYREVNKWTVRDVYPIPRIEQILEQLEGKELFTALDIHWGYNNIRIKEEDRWKAAFKTQYGLYQPNVMYFGLTNSPTTFQKTMDRVFQSLKNKYPGMLFVYLDNILITTINDPTLHKQIVHEVLDLLEKESFFLKLSKCKFEHKSIEYLGIVVENGTLKIDPTKREGLASWPQKLSTV